MKPRIKSSIIIASSNGKRTRRRVMRLQGTVMFAQRHNHNLPVQTI
jgi:hypothetical protein